ncbi:thiamine pyrophosphate-binding protein [Actinomadura yumaensis]|uniref:thiamine pyrophosphate-binding protein n=1 Tax=Actinomadura yumaensis TaxID=111807 RepID=UPI00361C1CBF
MQVNRHIYSELAGRRRFADAAVAALADAGVTTVFGMPAESLNAFVDALRRDGRIRLVGVRHEGAGALMAATYGKLTGVPGVCVGTAGPGATHLPLGVFEAHADRAPCWRSRARSPSSRSAWTRSRRSTRWR